MKKHNSLLWQLYQKVNDQIYRQIIDQDQSRIYIAEVCVRKSVEVRSRLIGLVLQQVLAHMEEEPS